MRWARTLLLGWSLWAVGARSSLAQSSPDKIAGEGRSWLDTEGHFINAHGAGILYYEGTWYLFGEIKKGATRLVPGQNWEDFRVEAGGVSCYSSRDLQHWRFEGLALAPDLQDSASDLYSNRVIERPKVIYNESTRQFVMWMHIDKEDYSYARAGVAVSDRPQGPYRYIGSLRPDGQMSRDMTLFRDEDGRAYLIYTSENNNTMHIGELSKDYLFPTGRFKRILVGQRREAPAVFRSGGRYYLITSLCSGWDPNAATYAEADSLLGDWQQEGNPCSGGDSATTFGAQSSYVLPLGIGGHSFLFMADRWNKTDLEHSGYLWLPLQIEQGRPVIRADGAAFRNKAGGVVLQQQEATPLSILSYDLALRTNGPKVKARTFVRFYDSTGRPLLEYAVPLNLSEEYMNTGDYTETPPGTKYLAIGMGAEGDEGLLFSEGLKLDWPTTSASHAPLCDLAQYLRPFWHSDTIFNETVLLMGEDGAAAGRLLYEPDHILSVQRCDMQTAYRKETDYTIAGRTILRKAGSPMPFVSPAFFGPKKDLAWYNLQSRWVLVTYTHHDEWKGPLPVYEGDRAPGLMNKLRSGQPVRIVAYGMSITRGMDVSGYDHVPPYMPTYMDLFAWGL
jgi:hypothetical protein